MAPGRILLLRLLGDVYIWGRGGGVGERCSGRPGGGGEISHHSIYPRLYELKINGKWIIAQRYETVDKQKSCRILPQTVDTEMSRAALLTTCTSHGRESLGNERKRGDGRNRPHPFSSTIISWKGKSAFCSADLSWQKETAKQEGNKR